jgi:hypothetical protein
MVSPTMEGATGGLHQLGVGRILQGAFDLYRRQAVGLWTIVALIVIPVQIVIFLIIKAALSGGTTFASGGTIYTSNSTAGPALSVVILGFVSAIVCIGALSKNLLDGYTGHSTDWRHSLAYAWHRFGSLLWLSILTGILVLIGYILLIIPGIYLTVAWLVAVPVLMFEGTGGTGALGRSRELVSGHWWMLFGALLVGIVIVVGISFAVGAIIGGIANSGSVNVILILSGLSRAISAIFTYPIVAAISAVAYVELRAAKEHIPPNRLVDVDPETPHPDEPQFGLSQPVAPTQPASSPSGQDEPPSHMPDIGLS